MIMFIFFAVISNGYAEQVPHIFTPNSHAKSYQVNENFQYLLDRIEDRRQTTVDCGTSGNGSGINDAINQRYNVIYIKGICKENIILDSWHTGMSKIALIGAHGDSKTDEIVDNSSKDSPVIQIHNMDAVYVANMSIYGGWSSINSYNTDLETYDLQIRNYSNDGINFNNGYFYTSKLTTQGESNSNVGLNINNASLNMHELNISGSNKGININFSKGFLNDVTIQGNTESESGIDINNSTLDMNDLYVNDNSQDGIRIHGSKGKIRNSEINNNIHQGIGIYDGSYFEIISANISGSRIGMSVIDGSFVELYESINITNDNLQSGDEWCPSIDVYNSNLRSHASLNIIHNRTCGHGINMRYGNFHLSNLSITGVSENAHSLLSFSDARIYINNAELKNHSNHLLHLSKSTFEFRDLLIKNEGVSTEHPKIWMDSSSGSFDNVSIDATDDSMGLFSRSSNVSIYNSEINSSREAIIAEASNFQMESSKFSSINSDTLSLKASKLRVHNSEIFSSGDECLDLEISTAAIYSSKLSTTTPSGDKAFDLEYNSTLILESSTISVSENSGDVQSGSLLRLDHSQFLNGFVYCDKTGIVVSNGGLNPENNKHINSSCILLNE